MKARLTYWDIDTWAKSGFGPTKLPNPALLAKFTEKAQTNVVLEGFVHLVDGNTAIYQALRTHSARVMAGTCDAPPP